eukprot:TRINITY_DN23408_c0_g1_i2.p1 TRINITY_DN23408_c0_g1~~TRINITY_DN23408_c0_g1_i2.p1  ORF type:complete len:429 (-),score=42.04 TRINITY_DN23408_c0_g1_i2:239-1525(-)
MNCYLYTSGFHNKCIMNIPQNRGKLSKTYSKKKGSDKDFEMSLESRLVHPVKVIDDPYSSMALPLYQNATFGQPGATEMGEYDYTRSGNPTRRALEDQMPLWKVLINRLHSLVGWLPLRLHVGWLTPGSGLWLGRIFTGERQGCCQGCCRIKELKWITLILPTQHKWKRLSKKETAACFYQKVPPILECKSVIQSNQYKFPKIAPDTIICVDNSIMGPIYQRPLDLGAHISMTSATKFIAGHSDVTGGILSVKGQELASKVAFLSNSEGAILAPFESWLAFRGLKTMKLRMDKQTSNCQAIAEFLSKQSLIQSVNYPGLKSLPGFEIHQGQSTSAGSLLSFTTGDVEVSKVIVEYTNLFEITVSFGSVTSLISMPCYMSHASIPAAVRKERGLPDDLVRISAGIEDIDDLIVDLQQAMDKARTLVSHD